MLTDNQLTDEMLEDVSGGARRRAGYKTAGIKAAKMTKMACPHCGAIIGVDINTATEIRCKSCGKKTILAG